MYQKKCPQCKNLISAKAPTCLFCGRPNRFVTNDYVKTKWENASRKNKNILFTKIYSKKLLFIIFILFLIIIFLNL